MVAVIGENKENGGVGTGTGDNGHRPTPRPVSGAPAIIGLMDSFGTREPLSADAHEYVAGIRKNLEDTTRTFPITTKQLGNGSFVFSAGNYSVILNMSGSVVSPQPNEIIRENSIVETIGAFQKEFGPDQVMVNMVSVSSVSYSRQAQMSNYIENTLKSATMTSLAGITLKDMFGDHPILIDTDPESVKHFFDSNDPIGYRCNQFGFIAALAGPNPKNPSDGAKHLFGVSGYTEFAKAEPQPGQPTKYNPVIHITNMLSVVPMAEMLSVILPIATDMLINRGLWKMSYALIKGNQNIGNLIAETGKNTPWSAKDEGQLATFFNSYVNHPVLCVDIVNGAPRIPGLGNIASSDMNTTRRYMSRMAQFLEIDPALFNDVPAQEIMREIIGYAKIASKTEANKIIDTRMFTYLAAVADIGMTNDVMSLQIRYPDPMIRLNTLRNIFGDGLSPQSLSVVHMLKGNFVAACSMAIGSKLKLILPQNAYANSIDFSQLGAQSGMYGQGNLFGSQAAPGFQRSNYTW